MRFQSLTMMLILKVCRLCSLNSYARTYSMFRVVFLQSLNRRESEQAIRKPIDDAACPVHLRRFCKENHRYVWRISLFHTVHMP